MNGAVVLSSEPSAPPHGTDEPAMGASVVIPVHNGARWLEDVLAAIRTARPTGSLEVIAIDDGSTDGSHEILARHASAGGLTLLDGARRGAAAALNVGIRAARYSLIAQIDQDVVIAPDWIERLVAALDDPAVAAAQGYYLAAPGAAAGARGARRPSSRTAWGRDRSTSRRAGRIRFCRCS